MSDKRLISFRYFGSKNGKLDWLLPLVDLPCDVYVEPFGGSAAVLLNRKQPSYAEVYNDLNSALVNFFKVLRDYPEELIRALSLTPYSREEFMNARTAVTTQDLDSIEWARGWFVRCLQGFMANPYDLANGWSIPGREGKGGSHSSYFSIIDGLHSVSNRLRKVYIEHRNAIQVIEYFDRPGNLIYLDPPYPVKGEPLAERTAYNVSFGPAEHALLCERVNRCSAKVAVSGYSEFLDTLYTGWNRYTLETTSHAAETPRGGHYESRTEVLYTNYTIGENDGSKTDTP